MVKPMSLSVPIGPGLHVVRLSGRGFGQTLVRTAHTAVSGFGKVNGGAATITNLGILPQKTSLCRQRVDGGSAFPAQSAHRDLGSGDETRVASEMKVPWIK